MSQVLSEQSSGRAFARSLRAHAAATRRLSAQLTADHGLTLSDYEVLLRLARAPDRRMRRVDLAEQVLLTRIGDHASARRARARAGFVERASCATDRRVVYAVLTDAGLDEAARGIREPRRPDRCSSSGERFDEDGAGDGLTTLC